MEEKPYGAYYQLYCLCTGGKAIKELHKITSMPKKDIKSWLAKQALWQVHIPPPKEIHHPHYDVTKPNEQHQFDLLYMPHNLFEGNTYKYILTGIDVASRYKVARTLRTKKSSEVAFVLEAIYKKGGVFKYPKTFQCDNGSEFKNEVTKLLEKHNTEIRRATTKHKHTHTTFLEAFNKELAKLLFKPMDTQELQDPEKVSTNWVKNLNKTVNKMNTESSMTGMRPKNAIKLDTVALDKTYPEETILPEDGLYRYLYQPGEQHGDQKRHATDLIWSKYTYQLDRIVQEPGNRVLYYLQDGPDRAFVRKELMHVSEDTQVPPDWVSGSKRPL